jgi:7-carboxy-7-deazaguanine synthase
VTLQASLVVSELFGPTLQSEGPSAGRLASFIRLSGCSLSCR